MRFFRILYLSTFLIFPISLQAQKNIKLEGIIGMEGGELFSYDLTAQSTAKNEYKGKVKTYAYTNKEVTAEVILKVYPEENKVELTETKILTNMGFKSNVTICLVRAVLTYEPGKGVLKGPIITQTSGDGAYCAIGNITFMNGAGIAVLFKDEETKDTTTVEPEVVQVKEEKPIKTKKQKTPEPKVVKEKTKEEPVIAPVEKPKEITSGKSESYNWESKELIMDLWDDNQEDGDKVTILHNGKEILKDYLLKSSPKRIVINLEGNELHLIEIKALNYGSEPPNTAMLEIFDGTKSYKIKAYNDPGNAASIRVLRKFN